MSAINYRRDIDGLRAVAVLGVLFFHAFPDLLSGGFVGVDVFFVISGYLISSIIFNELASSKGFSYLRFYERRARRIFPALGIIFITFLFLGYFSLFADEYKQLAKHIIAGAGFSSNIVLYKEAGYFDVASELKPLLHLWSLGIEEQFYFFLPPFLISLNFLKLKRQDLAIGLALLVSLTLCVYFRISRPTLAFYFPVTRAWELLAGTLLAYYTHYQARYFHSNNFVKSLTFAVGIFALLGCYIFFNMKMTFPGYWAIIPVTATILIIASNIQSPFNILSFRPMVAIGLISYPLYLWHWPVLVFARIMTPELVSSPSLRFIVNSMCLLASLALAWATYKFAELPIRRLAASRENRTKVSRNTWTPSSVMITAGLGAIATLAYFVFKSSGFPAHFENFDQARQSTLYYFESIDSAKAEECRNQFKELGPIGFCSISDKLIPPDIALIGDSIANQYYPGLKKYYDNKGQNLILLAQNGTPPYLGVRMTYSPTDVRTSDRYLNFAIQSKNIKTVVISSGLYTESKNISFQNSDPKDSPRALIKESLEKTFEALTKANKQIVIFDTNPYMVNFDQHSCSNHRPLRIIPFKAPQICGVKKQDALQALRQYRADLDEVLKKYPHVVRFDPSQYTCDNDFCYAKKQDIVLYAHDQSHLSIGGSFWISQFYHF